jgi:hypothetical protein
MRNKRRGRRIDQQELLQRIAVERRALGLSQPHCVLNRDEQPKPITATSIPYDNPSLPAPTILEEGGE